MSKDNKEIIDKEQADKNAYSNFWRQQKNVNVYNLFINGTTIMEIADKLQLKPTSVEFAITNRFFIQRLEKHMRGLMFTHQVSGVIANTDIFQKLWERTRDNINDIAPEICLKELTKLLPRKKEGLIVNPKNMNVFMKVINKAESPEDLGDQLDKLPDGSEESFGFEPLKETGKENYEDLGEDTNKDGIKRGDPPMDQEQPNTNQQGTPG